jgi:hypothetical protein
VHEDLAVPAGLGQAGCDFEAVNAGETNVEHHDVGSEPPHLDQPRLATRGFTQHAETTGLQ